MEKIYKGNETDKRSTAEKLILAALREFGDILYSVAEVTVNEERAFGLKNLNGFRNLYFASQLYISKDKRLEPSFQWRIEDGRITSKRY